MISPCQSRFPFSSASLPHSEHRSDLSKQRKLLIASVLYRTNQEDGSENRSEEECAVRKEKIMEEEELNSNYIITESCFSIDVYRAPNCRSLRIVMTNLWYTLIFISSRGLNLSYLLSCIRRRCSIQILLHTIVHLIEQFSCVVATKFIYYL